MPRAARKPTAAFVPVDGDGNIIQGAGGYPVTRLVHDDGLPTGDPPDDMGDDAPEQSAADRIVSTLSGIEGDERAIVKVTRKLANGKSAWCKDYSPQEYEAGGLEMIRQKWGPGDYSISVYGSLPGTKRFVLRTRAEISIDVSQDAPLVGVPSGGGGMGDALRLMSEQNAAILKALTEKPDPTASLMGTLAMMKAMREAMGGNEKRSDLRETLELMRELRGASEELNPPKDSEGDGSLLGMAGKLIPMIGQLMPKTSAPAPMPALPAIEGAPAIASLNDEQTPGIPAEGEPMSSEMLIAMKLRAYVTTLLVYAKSNVDPQKGADLIYERLPEEWIEILSLDTWWILFTEQVPQAVPYQEWMTKARDLAMARFEKEAAEDAEAEGGASESTGPAHKN